MFEIMDHTQCEDIDALLISSDFEKCFNKIEFEMIFQSLALFGIGKRIINVVKISYNGF